MADDKRPIIIKKVKKGGHGHHGGAWKVAYADFVTAMMAFFLLLWLLSSVEEGKLEQIAEYFTPTVGVRDQMGIGFEGGMTANVEGTKRSDRAPPGIIVGVPTQGPAENQIEKQTLVEGEKDAKLFERAEESIKRAFQDDPNLRDLADNVIVEQSPEGLKIEMMDTDTYPMFRPGSISLTAFGKRILSKLGGIIEIMPNFISITGHSDATPLKGRGGRYSNWELSADRANSARRYLVQTGMNETRVRKVTGKADTELLLPDNPQSPRNRRITIIMLRGSYLDPGPSDIPASRELLSVPKPGESTDKKIDRLRESEQKRQNRLLEKRRKPAEPSPLSPGQSDAIGTNPADAIPDASEPAVTGTQEPAIPTDEPAIPTEATPTTSPVGSDNDGVTDNPAESPASNAPSERQMQEFDAFVE